MRANIAIYSNSERRYWYVFWLLVDLVKLPVIAMSLARKTPLTTPVRVTENKNVDLPIVQVVDGCVRFTCTIA